LERKAILDGMKEEAWLSEENAEKARLDVTQVKRPMTG